MRFGIISFPGSNCEQDCTYIIEEILNQKSVLLDYRTVPDLSNLIDCLIIPGGFSYGDYLRAGAIAKASPIMNSIREFAEKKGLILGICNGFQILTEAGLLPGTLLNNKTGRFICQDAKLKVINNQTAFTNLYFEQEIITMPIAHAMGNFTVSEETLKTLRENQQIIFEYESDINGSISQIAGICNKDKNIFGLMPHPERCSEKALPAGNHGLQLFKSLLTNNAVLN